VNESLLIALGAAIVSVVFAVRDGVLAWWLIRWAVAGTGAGTGVGATTVPPSPPALPPTISSPRSAPSPSSVPTFAHVGITATSFAGDNDTVSARTSAYDGKVINGDEELAVALPSRGVGGRLVRVAYGGRSVVATVRDVGPWNTDDPYWATSSRPQAETGTDRTGRKTNLAGIDLTPALWRALGYAGDPRNAKDKVDWDFADAAAVPAQGAGAGPISAPAPATVPPYLALMRSLVGIDARSHSEAILGWAAAIGLKFPEMAEYTKGYTSTSVPWCGLTAAYAVAMSGVRPPFGPSDTDKFLWADSWRTFGTGVATPQPGDILVFHWSGGGHHVTMYDHTVDDNYYHCTGGNQGAGHIVSTESMPMKNCVAVRRVGG
jgi:hypothetical protein